jgi:hypothetical protein
LLDHHYFGKNKTHFSVVDADGNQLPVKELKINTREQEKKPNN